MQHLIISFNSFLDNLMVTKISLNAVAAVGSANRFLVISRATLLGINSGCSILAAQYFAKNDNKGITRAFALSLIASFIFYLIFLLFYFIYREQILQSFSSDLSIQMLCAEYMDVAIFSGIFLSALYPLMVVLRGMDIINFPFLITINLILINLTLNYLLIFGNYGFPKLGIAGAAIATIISEISTVFLAYLGSFLLGYLRFLKIKYLTSIPYSFIKKYVYLSWPLFISNFSYTVCMLTIHNIFGYISVEALSALGIIQPLSSFVYFLFTGLGNATAVILGQELGKKNFDVAYAAAKNISIFASISATILGGIIYFSSDFIASLYNLSTNVHNIMSEMIGIFGIFLWARIYNSVSIRGTLKSGGDSIFIFLAVTISSWLFALPACYLAFMFNWDAIKVYALLNFSEVLLAVMLIFRVRSKKWLKDLTEDT